MYVRKQKPELAETETTSETAQLREKDAQDLIGNEALAEQVREQPVVEEEDILSLVDEEQALSATRAPDPDTLRDIGRKG